MKTFITQIRATDPLDGQMKTWGGPNIEAESFEAAADYCRDNLGYCEVIGELVMEIDAKTGKKEHFGELGGLFNDLSDN